MKYIPLTKGKYALIDDEDWDLVSQYKWHVNHDPRYDTYRAQTTISKNGKKKTIMMHRLVMNAPKGMDVDHINHNQLDNRKSNLRIATKSQNQSNRNGLQSNNSNGYIGLKPQGNRWSAYIQVKGNSKYIGTFDFPEEAAKARDQAASEYFGEFATLNFGDVY